MRKVILIIFLLWCFGEAAFAQLVVVPISKAPRQKNIHPMTAARAILPAMTLPFWDDFSSSSIYPNDTLWQDGTSVSRNFGIGIKPPSLGVATFDGLDSLGKPYDVTNALAKGFADKLESRFIRMDSVPIPLRSTVYLSFQYQYTGNGEPPDVGDHFEVDFKNDTSGWETIVVIPVDTTLQTDVFNTMIVPVTDTRFFHAGFQFRFRSFGRLSGPYDTWNLDYVYLNSGRDEGDTSFPDRTISSPMTSIFNDYWSIPKKHFLTDIAGNLAHPTFDIYNLRVGNIQPLNYAYHADLISYKAGAKDSIGLSLGDSTSVGNGLSGLELRTVTIDSTLSPALFDPLADSFRIKLRLSLKTKDNVPPSLNGDYDSAKYYPIDFRRNDTTRSEFTLAKYYAYDDGTAEYGIGLNQPGAQVAYRFDMKTPNADTIVFVDLYFPRFGDESSQIILFRILSDLTDDQQSILYEENIPIDRSGLNKFVRHRLTGRTVLVQNSFYLGWKQSSAAVIPIGWDKNTNSGDRIWFNTNGSWEQNLIEKGSMMIHPVFGRGGEVTGLPPEEMAIDVYPNPSSGTFFVSGEPDRIDLLDMAGRPISYTSELMDHQTKIIMNHATTGVYVLKLFLGNQSVTKRVMVRP